MNGQTTISPIEAFSALQAWWREAGVEHVFSDQPTSWLKPIAVEPADAPATVRGHERQEPPVTAAPPPPGMVRDTSSLPQRLEDFAPWWLGEPSLDTGGTGPRIAPRGTRGARLMVIVPAPETTDNETLLSGPLGDLLTNMLAAMEIAAGDVYLASALPRPVPMADWAALCEAGLGTILNHHIALVGAGRVLLFGQALLPLLGHDPAQKPDSFTRIAHGAGAIPALASRDLQALLNSPRERAGFWRRWLEWTQSTAP